MAKNKAKLNKFLTGAVTVADPAHSAEVTIPEVSGLFALEVTTGAAKIQITVTLKNRVTGEVVEEDGIVQFQATHGRLGQTTSELQNQLD